MSQPEGGAHLRPVPAGAEQALSPDAAPDADGLSAPKPGLEGSRFVSDVIVELGILPRERVDAAVEEARSAGRTPEQVLLTGNAVTEDQLSRAIAQRFGLHHADLNVYKPDLAAANLIPAHAARRLEAVPIGFAADGSHLLVAIADPSNVLALDDLKLMTGHEIQSVVSSREDIAGVISRMSRLDDAISEAVEEEPDDLAEVTDIRETAEDAPVVKLVNSIIAQAVQDGASDVHFESQGREMRVRFRVDGVLHERTTIPRRMVPGTVSRVKIMADLDIAERRLPQDGRVSLTVEGSGGDIRVVTMPSVEGEGIVMRLLDKGQALIELDAMGMTGSALERFQAGFNRANGAVLVTGPTGSGKSSTLYAALNVLNSPDRNIITIEDPVEYRLTRANQPQANPKAGLSFARALRSMLRADPDVIMVGEIRDAETARIAVESALTGHLVLSTLHTNDAPSALTRLTEMGIEPFLSASAVASVVAQRLVRMLCMHCKRRTLLSASALQSAGYKALFDVEGYAPVGCGRCGGSGYRGRIGLYEVMPLSDEIRQLTIERSSADEMRGVALDQGMRSLRDDGFEKVKNGITSMAEVARVT